MFKDADTFSTFSVDDLDAAQAFYTDTLGLDTEKMEMGVMELKLDGTLVTGKYQMQNGSAGSLRGTFVDNVVHMERIDARTGYDSTFMGLVDGVGGRISGTWQANELAAGGPANGGWTAVRVAAR